MSFIQSKATLAASGILADIRKLRTTTYQAVDHLNSVVRNFLALNNEDLTEFGNMMSPQELQTLLGLHAQLGEGTNQTIQAVEQLLASLERRQPTVQKLVDVRPLSDKLAAQKRELTMTPEGKMLIQPIAYPPVMTVSDQWGAYVGQDFELPLTATNRPERFEVAGLPSWLTQNGDILSGTPFEEGVANITVTPYGLRGVEGQSLIITVTVTTPPVPEPVVEP